MRLLGLAIALVGIAAGIGMESPLGTFINLPGLLFVVFVGGGIVTYAHGFSVTWLAIRAVISGATHHPNQVRSAAETGQQAFVAAGWIGVIVGVIQMLSALDDPAHVGVGAAVALLTALYGYILAYVVCMPLSRQVA